MIRCGSCKFWSETSVQLWGETAIQPYTRNFGECENRHFKYGYHYGNEDLADDDVQVEDDEGWGLITGSKFGCVHGEKKK